MGTGWAPKELGDTSWPTPWRLLPSCPLHCSLEPAEVGSGRGVRPSVHSSGTQGRQEHPHHRLRSLCTPSLSRLCTPELHLKTSPLIASFVGEKLLSSKAEQDTLMQPEQYSGGPHCSCRQKGAHLLPCPRFRRKHPPGSRRRPEFLVRNTWQGMWLLLSMTELVENTCEET